MKSDSVLPSLDPLVLGCQGQRGATQLCLTLMELSGAKQLTPFAKWTDATRLPESIIHIMYLKFLPAGSAQ